MGIHIQPSGQAHQCYGVGSYTIVRKYEAEGQRELKGNVLPQDTDSARVKHQGKRELHGVPKPTLGKGAKQVAMCNQYHVTMLFTVHVVFVERTNLFNKIVNAVRDFLRRPNKSG